MTTGWKLFLGALPAGTPVAGWPAAAERLRRAYGRLQRACAARAWGFALDRARKDSDATTPTGSATGDDERAGAGAKAGAGAGAGAGAWPTAVAAAGAGAAGASSAGSFGGSKDASGTDSPRASPRNGGEPEFLRAALWGGDWAGRVRATEVGARVWEDVSRTNRDDPFFARDDVRHSMLRVLWCWANGHPRVGPSPRCGCGFCRRGALSLLVRRRKRLRLRARTHTHAHCCYLGTALARC